MSNISHPHRSSSGAYPVSLNPMKKGNFYKHLEILSRTHTRLGDFKDALLAEFLLHVNLWKDSTSAFNVFIILPLAAVFGILQWTKTDLGNV